MARVQQLKFNLTRRDSLNFPTRCCLAYHFVDDTNFLSYNNSVKTMNKQVNQKLEKSSKLAECK